MDKFVQRMADVFPQRREQIIFSINNYDVILSVMAVNVCPSVRTIFSEETHISAFLRKDYNSAEFDFPRKNIWKIDSRLQFVKISQNVSQPITAIINR
jgi:hypothetical protein